MTDVTPNLREKFAKACQLESVWKQHYGTIEKGQNGTEQDFYDRFDEIANELKARLEVLMEEIDNGKSVIRSPRDAYKHFGEPLKYEIVFPASMSEAQKSYIKKDGLLSVPGYQKLHEVCSSKEIDMDFRTAMVGSSYRTSTGETKRYHSISIEIDPARPYASWSDYNPHAPKLKKGNAGPT